MKTKSLWRILPVSKSVALLRYCYRQRRDDAPLPPIPVLTSRWLGGRETFQRSHRGSVRGQG